MQLLHFVFLYRLLKDEQNATYFAHILLLNILNISVGRQIHNQIIFKIRKMLLPPTARYSS